jgi:hypothetical protein
MDTMDDLKRKAEEGLKTLRETAQDLAFNVEKQAKIGKMKYIDLTRLQRNIQKAFGEIGEYVYDEITACRAVRSDDPYIIERIKSVAQMRRTIDDIEDEIAEMKRTQPGHGEEKEK